MSLKRAALFDVDQNIEAPPKKSNKIASPEIGKLKVFDLSETLLSVTVRTWLSGTGLTSSNASLPGMIRSVENALLKFTPPEFDQFGPCWTYYSRERRGFGAVKSVLKLVEGGTNNDSPR